MESTNSLLELLFNFLLIIVILLPLAISIFSVRFFLLTKVDQWHKNKTKIIRYILFLILLFLGISFLYELVFIDPESMFLYLFWPAPVGLSLIRISMIAWKKGTKAERILAIFSIIFSIIFLVWPFIFIMLK